MLSASRLALLRSTARKTDTTSVKVEESLSMKLKGIPAAYTADGVRKLLKAQEGDVTFRVTVENDRGEDMVTSAKRDADEALALYDDKPAPGAGRAGKKKAEDEPAPAGANGQS